MEKRTKKRHKYGKGHQSDMEPVSEVDDETISLPGTGRSSFTNRFSVSEDPPPAEPVTVPTPTQTETRSKASKSPGRQEFVDTSPRHRTAMGNYIVPEGGQPLTRLEAYPSAGPADHTLPVVNFYLHKSPEWSIPIRCLYQSKGSCAPPPNKYDLPDMVSLNRKTRFTFGKRLKQSKKLVAGPCRRGPTYNVRNHVIGKDSPKYSIPRAARDKFVTGPPNSLIIPDDTPGYRRAEAAPYDDTATRPRAPQAIITSRPVVKEHDRKPGPTRYTLPSKPQGPCHSFGMALPNMLCHETRPPPCAYNPKLLDNAPKFSIVSRKVPKELTRAPSPCAYMREREYSHKEGIHMGFVLPQHPPDKIPPCTAYNVRTDKVDPPYAYIRSRVKVPFPISLDALDAHIGRSPGPAAHTLRRYPGRQDGGITIKTRLQPPSDGLRPGPADHGRIEPDPLSTKPKAPAYSMRPVLKNIQRDPNPGPAAYRTPEGEKGPAWTIRMQTRPVGTRSLVPAPNAYIPPQGCTRFGPARSRVWGISLSSRHTPWQFAGSKIHPNAGLDVNPFLCP